MVSMLIKTVSAEVSPPYVVQQKRCISVSAILKSANGVFRIPMLSTTKNII